MKHLKLPLLVFLLLSCSKENFKPLHEIEKAPADAIVTQTVSIDEAEQEVLALVNMIDCKTRAGQPVRRIVNRYSNGSIANARAGNEETDTPLVHIFNFEDNQGYAIVAGDRRVSPVLCLTDEGNLAQDDVITNPGLLVALSEIDTYYRLLTGMPVTDVDGNTVTAEEYSQGHIPEIDIPIPDEPIVSYVYGEWEDYSTTGTIIPCHWHQYAPFNANCTTSDGRPAHVGCVAIAVGQIMYHWGLDYTYKDTYWNWTKMRKIFNDLSSPPYSDSWDLVQRLLQILGLPENLDMEYGAVSDSIGSGASGSNVSRTFQHFGYPDGGSLEDYDFDTVKSNLTYGPVYGQGHAIKTVKVTKILGVQVNKETYYTKGHAWVYDRSLVQRRMVKQYRDGILYDTYYQTRNLLHINWGWGGHDDGYYLSTRFDSNEGAVITRSTTTTTYGTKGYYQYQLQINCGIRAN